MYENGNITFFTTIGMPCERQDYLLSRASCHYVKCETILYSNFQHHADRYAINYMLDICRD